LRPLCLTVLIVRSSWLWTVSTTKETEKAEWSSCRENFEQKNKERKIRVFGAMGRVGVFTHSPWFHICDLSFIQHLLACLRLFVFLGCCDRHHTRTRAFFDVCHDSWHVVVTCCLGLANSMMSGCLSEHLRTASTWLKSLKGNLLIKQLGDWYRNDVLCPYSQLEATAKQLLYRFYPKNIEIRHWESITKKFWKTA
jgi:hypothetical protein